MYSIMIDTLYCSCKIEKEQTCYFKNFAIEHLYLLYRLSKL